MSSIDMYGVSRPVSCVTLENNSRILDPPREGLGKVVRESRRREKIVIITRRNRGTTVSELSRYLHAGPEIRVSVPFQPKHRFPPYVHMERSRDPYLLSNVREIESYGGVDLIVRAGIMLDDRTLLPCLGKMICD
ncbi:hypothetical protein TNCV_1811751 [Trichonephila clavipes]|nr:hypothetical protein TNCV_1811751 [Trichonephila clavipes]